MRAEISSSASSLPGSRQIGLWQGPGSPQPVAKPPIAVIGAGFSGVIAALRLLRQLPADQPVILCERAAAFAQGLAYATGEADHLLNVRAANMSAFEEEPQHFADWLDCIAPDPASGVHQTEAGVFASRGLYGLYLRSLLDQALRNAAHSAQLRLMPDNVIDAIPKPEGYELHCASGNRLDVAGIVLANGNLPAEESGDPRICANPWGRKAGADLHPDTPVLIVGTGLTMVDLAVSMRRRGFRGPILAMSRGGLLPSRHAPAESWPTPAFGLVDTGSLASLLVWLRREIRRAAAEGVSWRAVIDSLRPVTPAIWARLPRPERERFLRHARRYWEVHRHRMAPPHAERIEAMVRDGSLRVLAGRIRLADSGKDGVDVHYSPRGRPGETRRLQVQRVILASGLEPIGRTRDLLMRNLLDRGLARIDVHGLGLEVTDDLAVLREDGSPADRIWALGPIVRGVFWECVAVPDIRSQAGLVAASVDARLLEDAPRWSFTI